MKPKPDQLTDHEKLVIETKDLAFRVVALGDLLGKCDVWGDGVSLSSPEPCLRVEGSPNDLVWIDLHQYEPSTSHAVSRVSGLVVEHTCQYSGHNGDSYGDKYRLLTHKQSLEVLQGLNALLERRAVDWQKRRLKQQQERRLDDEAAAQVKRALRAKGVFD